MPRVKLILVLHPEGRSGERLRKGGSLALCVRTPTERECALRVHLTRSPNHWGMSGIRALPSPLACLRTTAIRARRHRRSSIVRPVCGSRASSLNGQHGEGFRMPFGVRKPPKHEPAGLRRGLWGFLLFTERDNGGVGSSSMSRRMRRTRLCARRSVASDLPLAMFSRSVKVLTTGAWMAVAGTTGIAAWGEGFPCRVTTASRLLCEPGAVRAAASSARTSR
jgi:hypothetical protein